MCSGTFCDNREDDSKCLRGSCEHSRVYDIAPGTLPVGKGSTSHMKVIFPFFATEGVLMSVVKSKNK